MAATFLAWLSPRCRPWCLLAFWALFSSCLVHDVVAQTAINGQTYTNGLAILNSPQMGSTLQVGGTMNIAIDVSGNGKLSAGSTSLGSTDSTRITFLEAYLISEQTFTNLTVVQGPGFLQGESGSTVKHSSITVPSCAAPGSYDLTIYETSVMNGTGFFTITSIPVRVTTSRPGGKPCSTLFNNILPLPQASSPPLTQPWLGISEHVNPSTSSLNTDLPTSQTISGASSQGSGTSDASSSQTTNTFESASSSFQTSSASDPSSTGTSDTKSGTSSTGSESLVTVTKTRDGKTTTRTVTRKPATVTRVSSSVQTEITTLTESGKTEVLTTTELTLSTTTKVVGSGPTSVPGFFPVVNSATLPSSSIPALASIPALMYILML